MSDKNYITPEGYQKLQAELRHLMTEERPKVVEAVAWAASNGDRSENADYIYGKRRLREFDRRVRFLTERLDKAVVVEPLNIRTDRVVFGAWVALETEDGATLFYQLVGEDEFDVAVGKISWKSPVGQALMGKAVDDEITVQTPKGVMHYTLIAIARTKDDISKLVK